MAYQDMPSFMVSDRHIAVAALDHVPAARADDERVIAPPVEQQDDLPLFPEGPVHRLPERLAQPAQEALLVAQVDHVDGRHRPALDPICHDQPRVLSQLGVSPAFQRRRGRAQEHRHALELRPLDRDVAGMIPRHGLLLERAFMFLVNDDQPQPPRRREDRRAGAHDHFHLARRDALPVPMTLDVAQMAVQHGHPIKPPAEPADRLRSEADLGNQHDRLAAPGHDLLDRR